jgi:beta-lactamase class A
MIRRSITLLAAVGTSAALLSGCAAVTPASATRSAVSGTASAPAPATPTAGVAARQARLTAAIRTLEAQHDERIGVTVQIVGGEHLAYRGGERFALDSTSKLFTATLLLRDDTDAQLAQVVHYTTADLQSYSPITSQHVATGMSLRDVITAALRYSDNTAANLMFEQLGGPAAAERGVRELGDRVTNLDRTEPDLNTAIPGDSRDTTTPDQIASDLQRFALGDVLTPSRRAFLVDTMRGNTTGDADVRAAVPSGWTVADKTGSGGYGTANDVALVTRPGGPPVVITIYTSGTTAAATTPDGIVGDVAKAAVATL